MKRLFSLFLALFLLPGCSKTSDDSASDGYIDPSIEMAEAAPIPSLAVEASTRPDALHPLNGAGEFPAGWEVRLDRPNPDAIIGKDKETDDVSLINMTPGWHFRTKTPRVILYHPASSAYGSYSISSKIHLFDPGKRSEAYGLIFGGSDLDREDQHYLYFVIRRTGEYLIKQRVGNDTVLIKDWTDDEAVVPFDENTEQTATNTLAVSVTADTITYSINDVEVYSMTKGNYQTDGLVGFRFNHGVEAHIETFDVSQSP